MNHLEVNHQIVIKKNLNVYSLNYLVEIALSIWFKKVDKSQK